MTRRGRNVLIEIRRKQFGWADSTDKSLICCRATRFHYDKGLAEIQWRSPPASPCVVFLTCSVLRRDTSHRLWIACNDIRTQPMQGTLNHPQAKPRLMSLRESVRTLIDRPKARKALTERIGLWKDGCGVVIIANRVVVDARYVSSRYSPPPLLGEAS
jgi:hypothetical protein